MLCYAVLRCAVLCCALVRCGVQVVPVEFPQLLSLCGLDALCISSIATKLMEDFDAGGASACGSIAACYVQARSVAPALLLMQVGHELVGHLLQQAAAV